MRQIIKKYPKYQMITISCCIDHLKEIYNLLDLASEFFQCEKPHSKKTIGDIGRIMYLVKVAIKEAPTKNQTKMFDVRFIGKDLNLINKIDAQNIFGPRVQIY